MLFKLTEDIHFIILGGSGKDTVQKSPSRELTKADCPGLHESFWLDFGKITEYSLAILSCSYCHLGGQREW